MRIFSSVAVVLTVLSSANGYLIDRDSCKSDEDYNFVKAMVEQAFTMANIAAVSVSTTPFDPNASWLLKQLFDLGDDDTVLAKAMIEGVINVGATDNTGQTKGIKVFEEEKTGSLDDLSRNEVVLFCNTDRFTRRAKDPLHLYDTKVKQAVDSKSSGCENAFMVTRAFDGTFDTIDVCSWFLQYAVAKKYQTKNDLRDLRAFLAVKGLDKFITDKVYTPIDLLSLWDKTMFHEFMHTKPAGKKDDVGGFDGYGWKNCKGLATQAGGKNNADSFAIFASAMYWFNQGSPIDENGNFYSPAMAPQSGSRRWLGSGIVRGVEAVKLAAVERFT